jgi:hypothetical protein
VIRADAAERKGAGRRAAAPRAFRRYVIALLVATIGAIPLWIVASVLLTRTSLFVRSSTYVYDVIADQRFALRGARHDVLVIGDSSALRGVIPADISRRTGLDVYNASLFAFSGIASYDLLLEHYLVNNAAPKLVVLYVTATQPPREQNPGTYERTLVEFRYGSLADIAALVADNPGVVFWPAAMLRKTFRWRDWHGRFYDATAAELARNDGFLGGDEAPLRDDCNLDSRTEIATEHLVAFRRKWAARLNDFAIYIAPMAACDRAYSYYAAQYRAVADNAIAQLPSHWLVDYTHASAAGAHETSRLLADFIERRRQNWK